MADDTDDDIIPERLPSHFSFKSVTVKFHLDSGFVITQSFLDNSTMQEVKNSLVDMIMIPAEKMLLRYTDTVLSDSEQLGDLPTDKYGIIDLRLSSNDHMFRIRTEKLYPDLGMPDVITVRVQTEDQGIMDVVVEIEDKKIDKPFEGGFVDTSSGLEYVHGFSQTGPPPPKVPAHLKNHRDTQTVFTRNRKQQMTYSRGTQMANKEIYIPSVTDRILVAGPYETAEEREKRIDIEGKVRTIQRYYRAWKMRKTLKELSAEYKKRIQKELEAELLDAEMDEERKRKELICKVFPYTTKDFAMLYAMLERWKKNEIKRINSTLCGAAKIAEFYMLLDREIEMLQSIEKLYQQAKADRKLQKDMDFFKEIGIPLAWNSDYKNIYIEMDTLETQKAREYFELYDKFCDRTYNKEDRLKVLIDVKAAIANHHCEVTIELNKLIDRTCDLITRDLEDKMLENLQKRMEGLLIHHIKAPSCNEGVTNRPSRVKEKLMENNLYFCHRCQKLKTMDEFAMNARMNKIRVCASCNAIDRASDVWADLAPYSFILKQIRRKERLYGSLSSVAYILQDKDIYHLINVIWHAHSALSECTNIYQLRLCRWNKEQTWSPWNCILLTNEECKAHLHIENLEEVYEEEFLNHVFNKHALARKHFIHICDVEEAFTQKREQDPRFDGTKDYKKFIPVNSRSKIFFSCH